MNKSDEKWKAELKKNWKKVPFKCRIRGLVACCTIREDEGGNRIYYCDKIDKDVIVDLARDWEPQMVKDMKNIPECAEAWINWRPKSDAGKRMWIKQGFTRESLENTGYA